MAETDHQNESAAGQQVGQARRHIEGCDLAIAALIIAGCAVLFYVTTTFDDVAGMLAQNTPPAMFPRILLVIIAGLALALPFEHRFSREGYKKLSAQRSAPVGAPAWASIGLIVAIAVGAPYLGTIVTILCVLMIMPAMWGERRWWLIAGFAVLFTGLVTFVFRNILQVYFEPGVLALGLG